MFVRGRGVWFGFPKKMIYVLLGKIRKTCFLVPTTVVLLYFYSFTNNGWSLWLLENTC